LNASKPLVLSRSRAIHEFFLLGFTILARLRLLTHRRGDILALVDRAQSKRARSSLFVVFDTPRGFPRRCRAIMNPDDLER
jgi:hypothetical protein